MVYIYEYIWLDHKNGFRTKTKVTKEKFLFLGKSFLQTTAQKMAHAPPGHHRLEFLKKEKNGEGVEEGRAASLNSSVVSRCCLNLTTKRFLLL